jgi:hypothetical protein
MAILPETLILTPHKFGTHPNTYAAALQNIIPRRCARYFPFPGRDMKRLAISASGK